MDLAPGTVFAGDYRVVRRLSAGGMGAVFVVEQLSTGKPRALKLMHQELVSDPSLRQRFEQEARIGSRIASEHVVEVQAAGVDAQTHLPYLVMELLEGEDMASRLRRGPFSIQEAAEVLEQLAHALGAAHDAGVVHRDLKPENIFLARPRRSGASIMVKVLDFGIAKVTEGRNTTSASGTPLWLSPEQTTRGMITPAADVWAMGLVVFAMLAGRVFWRSGAGPNQSIAGLLSEIMMEPIPYASQRVAELGLHPLPPGFDAWFARCVARDPAMRLPNARAAFAELAPILRPPAPVQTYVAPPQPIAMVQPKPQSSGWGCVIGIVLALLIVAGAAAWGVYVLVQKGEQAADEAVNAIASAANSAAQQAASDSGGALPTPSSSSSSSDAPGALTIMPMSDDETLRAAAERQINLGFDKKFSACVGKAKQKRDDGLDMTVVLDVKADGTVASAMNPLPINGPDVQCVIDTAKTMKFPATRKGSQVMLIVSQD